MKKFVIAVVTVGVLQYFKPIERLPYVGAYAKYIEAVGGLGLVYFGYHKKSESAWMKGVAEGMLMSGFVKILNDVPKVI